MSLPDVVRPEGARIVVGTSMILDYLGRKVYRTGSLTGNFVRCMPFEGGLVLGSVNWD